MCIINLYNSHTVWVHEAVLLSSRHVDHHKNVDQHAAWLQRGAHTTIALLQCPRFDRVDRVVVVNAGSSAWACESLTMHVDVHSGGHESNAIETPGYAGD